MNDWRIDGLDVKRVRINGWDTDFSLKAAWGINEWKCLMHYRNLLNHTCTYRSHSRSSIKLHYLSGSRKIEPNNSLVLFMYMLVALMLFCLMPPGVRNTKLCT